MMIPDLKELEFWPGSPPSPEPYPVTIERDGKLGYGFLSSDMTLRPVGWLGDRVTSIGDVPASCIDKLFLAYERGLIFSDGSAGFHVCEICRGRKPFYTRDSLLAIVRWNGRKIGLYGHGHYLIRCEQTVYMAPALLLHYILHHRYKPPDQFERAVIEGRILAADDLLFKPMRDPLTGDVAEVDDEVEVEVDGIRFGKLRRF
jgi:hypothetical protein